MRTLRVTILAAGLTAALSSYSAAQNRLQEQRDVQRPTGKSNIDRELATCLAIDAQPIIQVTQLAQTHAARDDVKQFAEMLQRDHNQCLMRLKQIEPSVAAFVSARPATAENRDSDAAAPRRVEPQTTTEPPRQARVEADRPRGGAVSATDTRTNNQDGTDGQNTKFLQIKREIAEANVDSLKQALEAKPKADFDRCFVGYQVGAHMLMLDTLKVFERHAGPELAAAIKETAAKTQAHLQQAERLLQSLEDTPAAADSRAASSAVPARN
jgi:hypothetical protein